MTPTSSTASPASYELYFSSNELSSVDADLFDGLTSLLELSLDRNELSSVDADLFDGLTSLQKLRLHNNELTNVDADLFDGLTSLLELFPRRQRTSRALTPQPSSTVSPACRSSAFDNNELTNVDADLFDGLTSLLWLYLYDNSISTLPACNRTHQR